jgi:hypothetical protein
MDIHCYLTEVIILRVVVDYNSLWFTVLAAEFITSKYMFGCEFLRNTDDIKKVVNYYPERHELLDLCLLILSDSS